ncbi:MAG TPA: hypothetical protein VNV37_10170 [Solirubrobacteraceae bacterium]|jgi:hypothetical protein|nr:hypothetical protein [Solirubrobacteraceae bacterium]
MSGVGVVASRAQKLSTTTPVAWMPTGKMDLAEWTAAGRQLGAMGRCGPWRLGDWIRYGDLRFGQRYTQAARITGYDVQTLMNMVSVASSFEISRRRENLSWSHHETVAGLKPAEQDDWLERAEKERLSVADLRIEVRAAHRARIDPDEAAAGTHIGAASPTVCPTCGSKVPPSRRSGPKQRRPRRRAGAS